VGLTELPLNILRDDEEFILYRGEHSSRPGSRSIVPLAPSPSKPSPERLEHEYSLRNELDPAWAARPVAATKHLGQTGIVFEDPGGKPLDRFPSEPGELKSFLRIAVGLGNALGGLHKRGLVHKNIKPANILINGASSGGAADGLRHRFTLGARAPVAAPAARDDSRLQNTRPSTKFRSFSFGKQEDSIWRGL
jgi:serine/threonine protein kinase